MAKPPVTKPATLSRFTGYRVQPVVETTAPDGFEKSYQAFPTLSGAEAELSAFARRPTIDGVEGQQILWSLYGLHQDMVEHIADRSTEAEAFSLLYAISGIPGVLGQSLYRLPGLWMIVHEHRHGVDTWTVASDDLPTETQLVRCLNIDFEPGREEEISISPLSEIPLLDRQTGDDEPFVEPTQ